MKLIIKISNDELAGKFKISVLLNIAEIIFNGIFLIEKKIMSKNCQDITRQNYWFSQTELLFFKTKNKNSKR